MNYILQTSELTKKYKNFWALKGLSMHVPNGSIYGLVGKNGAGKTTLIRLICGLQKPTKGSYILYGIKNTDRKISASRRRMGAVVETPAIYMDMTAEDNLKQQCLILGVPAYDSIPEILELVGLKNTGSKKAKHFSLGMKQRLGIAVALVGNPDFLVLDELSRLATHYGFVDDGRMIKEISAEELESICRKCLHVEVTDTMLLARVLDASDLSYDILSDTEANIYGKINLTQLIIALQKEGCEVITSREQDESLESYFINLIGGEQHD